ncbi:hypothetical protein EMCG_05983 [[Emmonsia] crescens]|uniref:Uncharacterized protein n=1 Tax=[Emmonsia] crescens TaxID=73230 RepID=A0A0G2ICJ1_9EURO|nr:hypothetical protein EMCG_05983 [Emmonsia crescens UAMH 3008]
MALPSPHTLGLPTAAPLLYGVDIFQLIRRFPPMKDYCASPALDQGVFPPYQCKSAALSGNPELSSSAPLMQMGGELGWLKEVVYHARQVRHVNDILRVN